MIEYKLKHNPIFPRLIGRHRDYSTPVSLEQLHADKQVNMMADYDSRKK